mgnify:CR=1 FL=1
MSLTRIIGFVGVSMRISRVSGRSAARTRSPSAETRAAYAQAIGADLVAPVEQFRKRIAEAGLALPEAREA